MPSASVNSLNNIVSVGTGSIGSILLMHHLQLLMSYQFANALFIGFLGGFGGWAGKEAGIFLFNKIKSKFKSKNNHG